MTSLTRIEAARARAALCSLFTLAAASGCTKPYGDLGSIDLPETEGASATETAGDATAGATDEDPTGSTITATTTSEPQGPPDDWDDELTPQAGTRLRPIVREAEDGSTQHVAWQDTQEAVRCSFRVMADGSRRCVPELTATYIYYADPECKIPVMRTYDGYPHDILEIRGEAVCEPGTFYRLDPEPYVGTLYRDEGWDGCFEHSMDEGYYKGTAMAETEFVAAAVQPAEGTSRIVPLILAAEDGARAIAGAWDREHGEEVVAAPGNDAGTWRWYGRYAASHSKLFADAACSEPIAGTPLCTPPDRTPATAQTPATFGCEPLLPQRWRLAEPLATSSAFQGDACNPTETSYWEQMWSLGEPLTDEDFGVATEVPVDGSRLQRIFHGNADGEPILGADVFYDAMLGESCRFWRNPATDESRCEPLALAQVTNIYLDAACTQQVAYVNHGEDCGPVPLSQWAQGPNGTLLPLLDVTEWGDFKIEDGDCVPADGDFDYPGGLGNHTVYTVGAPADFTLVEATDVVQ